MPSTENPEPDLYGIKVARHWLKTCTTNHRSCSIPALSQHEASSSTSTSTLPGRLLDVGLQGSKIPRLVDSAQLQDDCQYVTLSHCWGDASKVPKTKLSNLQRHYDSIDWGFLSRSFQDAINITQRLGYQYLWIDSLCIVQDSPDDFEGELSRMHTTYASCHVMIAADDAQSGEEGFLSYWSQCALSDPENSLPAFDKDMASAFRSNNTIRYVKWSEMMQGPLSRRGWACQERQLAPRVLHYTKFGVMWECRMCIGAGERNLCFRILSGNWGRGPNKRFLKGLFRILDRCTRQKIDDIMTCWHGLIEDYTARQLSFPDDKLRAISALTAIVSNICPEAQECLFGLWEYDIAHQLCWYVPTWALSDADEKSTMSSFQSPSWSWCSHNRPISYVAPLHNSNEVWRFPRQSDILQRTNNYNNAAQYEAKVDDYFKYYHESISMAAQKPIADFSRKRLKIHGKFVDENYASLLRRRGGIILLYFDNHTLATEKGSWNNVRLLNVACSGTFYGTWHIGLILQEVYPETFRRIGLWVEYQNFRHPGHSLEERNTKERLGTMILV